VKYLTFIITAAVLLSGCVEIPLAPGADQVRITRSAAEVAACRAVGNIEKISGGTWDDKQRQMKNQAVGLGGNVIFNTMTGLDPSGVVYRCP
jgi:hypothetical protein